MSIEKTWGSPDVIPASTAGSILEKKTKQNSLLVKNSRNEEFLATAVIFFQQCTYPPASCHKSTLRYPFFLPDEHISHGSSNCCRASSLIPLYFCHNLLVLQTLELLIQGKEQENIIPLVLILSFRLFNPPSVWYLPLFRGKVFYSQCLEIPARGKT